MGVGGRCNRLAFDSYPLFKPPFSPCSEFLIPADRGICIVTGFIGLDGMEREGEGVDRFS